MSAHPLKIHHHPAKRPSQHPPLLFVHGGYTNARCWEHNFIPYFQQKGYDCHALDLSGHGESGGHDQLHDFGIKDYARDVAHAVAELPARPVPPTGGDSRFAGIATKAGSPGVCQRSRITAPPPRS